MRKLLLINSCLICVFVNAQSNLNKGEFIVKWDVTRLLNPFNSTVQLGVEFAIKESLTISSDIGIHSDLYHDINFYNKSIFISHNQLRKYKRNGHFYGLDLFYMRAKDHADFRCLYDKNKKINADYTNATLIKNAPGLAIISGRQIMSRNVTIDLFFGVGLRLVSNKIEYDTQTIHIGSCQTTHYSWHNDKYSGTFVGGHFSLGLKLGYILNRKAE